MAKILTYRRWSYTLHLFRRWLSNKFSAIKIDLTPVEEKLDTTVAQESTSQEIKTLILQEGIEHANEYAQQINEIIGDWSNE